MKQHALTCAMALAVALGLAEPLSAQGNPPAQGAPAAQAQPWRPAPANLAAFHVSVAFAEADPGQVPAHRCTGIAISRNWVLVSAFCVSPVEEDETPLEAGDIRIYPAPRVDARSRGIAVNLVVRHPDYNAQTLAHDIGLIRTSAPLPAGVTPVALPTAGTALPETGVVVGWQDSEDGNRRTLVNMSVPFVQPEACQQAIRAHRLDDARQQFDQLTESLGIPAEPARSAWASLEGSARYELPQGAVCAGPPAGYPCSSDPGASLLQVQGGSATLIGVATSGEACEIAGVPNLFTSVGAHLDWIRSVMSQ